MSTSDITSGVNIIIKAKNEEFAYLRALFTEKMLKIVMSESDKVQQHIAKSAQLHRTCTNKDCQATYTTIKYKCDKCKSKVVKVNPEFENVTKTAGRDEKYVTQQMQKNNTRKFP